MGAGSGGGTSGTLFGWGDNRYGQLCQGDFNNRHFAVGMPSFNGSVSAVYGGRDRVVYVLMSGMAMMCGRLWDGTNSSSAVSVIGGVRSVALSGKNTFFVLSNGSLFGYGANLNGSLGVGGGGSVGVLSVISSVVGMSVERVVSHDVMSIVVLTNGSTVVMGLNEGGFLSNVSAMELFGAVVPVGRFFGNGDVLSYGVGSGERVSLLFVVKNVGCGVGMYSVDGFEPCQSCANNTLLGMGRATSCGTCPAGYSMDASRLSCVVGNWC